MAAAEENISPQKHSDAEQQSPNRYDMSAHSNNSNNSNIQDSGLLLNNDMRGSLPHHDFLTRVKEELNKERKILIKNIPQVSSEEVKIFLGYYLSKNVELDRELLEAVITLENGEEAEEIVANLNRTKFHDEEVTISIMPSRKLLCLAHLPLDFTDQDLRNLVSSRGNITKCFVMRSKISGDNKGYGFVEFAHSCKHASSVKENLDGTTVREYKIDCDIVDENIEMNFDLLHSRCLLIDNLPTDYSNALELRDIFSQSAVPIYCQIMTNKNGDPLGCGIIEYRSADEAEKAQKDINGRELKGVNLRVTCCIPGKSAVSIYNRIMTRLEDTENKSNKSSLLPAPIEPCTSVLNHPIFKSLSTKHPDLLQSFKNVLSQLQETYIEQMNEQNSKPGLLGPAPNLCVNPLLNPNMQLGLCILLALQAQSQKQKLTGPLTQHSLLQMLQNGENARQQDSTNGQVSIFGDPTTAQASILIQNFLTHLNQVTSDASTSSIENKSAILYQLTNLSSLNLNTLIHLGQVMGNVDNQETGDGLLGSPPIKGLMDDFQQGSQISLNDGILPLPSGERDGLLGSGPPDQSINVFMKNIQALATGRNPPGIDLSSFSNNSSDVYSDVDNSNFSDFNFSSSFNQGSGSYGRSSRGRSRGRMMRAGRLKGVGYNFSSFERENFSMNDNFFHQPFNGKMNNVNKTFSEEYSGQQPYAPQQQGNYNQNYSGGDFQQDSSCCPSGYGSSNQFSASSEVSEQYYTSTNKNKKNRVDAGSHQSLDNYTSAQPGGYMGGSYSDQSSYRDTNLSFGNQMQDRYDKSSAYNSGFQAPSSFNKGPIHAGYQSRDKFDNASSYRQGSYGSTSSGYNSASHSNSSFSSNMNSSFSSNGYGQDVFDASHSDYCHEYDTSYDMNNTKSNSFSGANNYNSQQPFRSPVARPSMTPIGQKRSYSQLLPQPEASPDGEYIGQHSQGLGGHYADSYLKSKRQKLDQMY